MPSAFKKLCEHICHEKKTRVSVYEIDIVLVCHTPNGVQPTCEAVYEFEEEFVAITAFLDERRLCVPIELVH